MFENRSNDEILKRLQFLHIFVNPNWRSVDSCGKMMVLYRNTCVVFDSEYFLVHLQAIRFQFLLTLAMLCSVCSRKFNLSSIWMPRDLVDDFILQRRPFIKIAGFQKLPALKTIISVSEPLTTIRHFRHQF